MSPKPRLHSGKDIIDILQDLQRQINTLQSGFSLIDGGTTAIIVVSTNVPVVVPITFAVAFDNPPILVCNGLSTAPQQIGVSVGSITTTGANIYGVRTVGTTNFNVNWLAYDPT